MPFNGLCHEDRLWLLENLCDRFDRPFDSSLLGEWLTAADPSRGLDGAIAAVGLQWQVVPLTPAILAEAPESLVATMSADGVQQVILLSSFDEAGVHYRTAECAEELELAPDEFFRRVDGALLRVGLAPASSGNAAGAFGDPRAGRWLLRLLGETLRQEERGRLLLASFLLLVLVVGGPLLLGLFTTGNPSRIADNLLALSLIALLTAVGCALLLAWREAWQARSAVRLDAGLSREFFRRVFSLPLAARRGQGSAELAALLRQGEPWGGLAARAAASLVFEMPALGCAVVAMLVIAWPAALALGVVLLAGGLPAVLLAARLLKAHGRREQFAAAYGNGLGEGLAMLDTVHLMHMEGAFARRLASRQDAHRGAAAELARTRRHLQGGLRALAIAACGSVLVVLLAGGASLGTTLASLLLAGLVLSAAGSVFRLVCDVLTADRLSARLRGLLAAVPAVEPMAACHEEPDCVGIAFENLAFRYDPSGDWLFRDLSFAVKPGRLTVLVGPSGCGKSTLVKLLLGLERPAAGRVLVGGRDVHEMSREEMRPLFGVVPQESVLFAGTILANLRAAHGQAAFEEVVAACRASAMHDFIESLPAGYQTMLEEGGRNLSVGQRQRLAIARALLRQPRILVLDESFAPLDPPTAEAIGNVLNCLRGELTVLFITHQIPRGLTVDAAVVLSGERHVRSLEVVEV